MAFRSQKATCIFLVTAGLAAAEVRIEALHDHSRKNCRGVLVLDEAGVAFTSEGRKKPHAWRWDYRDIQQLHLSDNQVRVLTYADAGWQLGRDRRFEFNLPKGGASAAYRMLKDRLDQRLVAALADTEVQPLWRMPVKRLGRWSGVEGELVIGEDRIVFRAARAPESRTWRYQDVENVSSSGPFRLALTTYERAAAHYGDLRGFEFQLKEPLDERRYEELWLRLNQRKGLKLLE